jgi:hypothetical protein
MVHGYTAKEIARERSISYRTVQAHSEHIIQKLLPPKAVHSYRTIELMRLVYGLDEPKCGVLSRVDEDRQPDDVACHL